MNKWGCSINGCRFIGTGEPTVFLGRFYCDEHDPHKNWIVVGYQKGRAGSQTFEVHKGDKTAKETQDGIAEYAGEHPELIYMVVRESDYRQAIWDGISWLFKPRGK